MERYNVLVFPCGTEMANEIINSLVYHKYFRLLFASSERNTYCDFRIKLVHWLPFVTEQSFEDELDDLIVQLKIDYIIPAHDDVALKLSLKEKYHEITIGQSSEVNSICRYKDKTYEIMKDHIDVPIRYSSNPNIDVFPLFVKPKKGQGSQDTRILYNRNDYIRFKEGYDIDKYVVMEYLPGEEYTIDCFSDSGNLLYFGPRTRERTVRGIATVTRTVSDTSLNDILKGISTKISQLLGMHGLWFFQMKCNKDGNLKLLEIGPRVSGSMMLNRVKGINFVELAIYQKIGYPVEVVCNEFQVSLARALVPRYNPNIEYSNVYIDFDDTLYIDERFINTQLMRLIFQSINEGKRIYLITKNEKGNLESVLSKYHIKSIFDEIIHLSKDENKSDYIKKDSILIDDSFHERKEAIQKGIIAFGIDSIGAIIHE